MNLSARRAAGIVLLSLCAVVVPVHGGVDDLQDKLTGRFWERIRQASGAPQFNVAQLAFITHLSSAQQMLLLEQVGKRFEQNGGLRCNIFGSDSCQSLPEDSKFAQLCPNHPLTVDCAYYDEALADIDEDPIAAIRDEMSQRGDEPCEQCIRNQQELWCAQALPPCGSFRRHVELAVLPVVAKLAETSLNPESGPLDKMQALTEAMPGVLNALSLSMPCREMCKAVLDTCDCGSSHTFGYLVDSLRKKQDANLAVLPPEVQESVFNNLWDVEICDLYTPSTDPNFSGHCTAESKYPQTSCRWCGDQDMGLFSELQISSMMVTSLVSWVNGPMGLLAVSDEMEDEAYKDYLVDEEEYVWPESNSDEAHSDPDANFAEIWTETVDEDLPDKHGGGSSGAVVTSVVVLLVVVAAAVGGGYYYFNHFRGRHQGGTESAWAVESGTDYVPMDYEAPGVPLADEEPSGVL
uniref:FZ domain-containing protein n=1 Tax=Pyramimonas obovata TaxID=1411642 RepID=A0A7S0R6S6_9CHLO|mmetsp:Transcript_27065/g.59064  ORF Transcript_27065/g.59064 Transcript_27065/m.59064 type:complete len:464 (+) Transcript_27065:211-1602(+)